MRDEGPGFVDWQAVCLLPARGQECPRYTGMGCTTIGHMAMGCTTIGHTTTGYTTTGYTTKLKGALPCCS
ncbi:MAG: hypothetical protein WBV46_17585 [Terriglobales bacterium]